MKRKKVDWFTRNSTLFFIVLLCLGIIFFNLFIAGIKNFRIDHSWVTFAAMIISVVVFLLIVMFLVFIIYYEDYRQAKNKRKFKLFETIIHRFLDKGANQ